MLAENTSDWPICQYYEQKQRSTQMSATPWAKATNKPKQPVRRLQFRMPVPQDVPKAIARLISLPKDSAMTVVGKMSSEEGELVLGLQIATHDVPFGEKFLVEESVVFSKNEDQSIQ